MGYALKNLKFKQDKYGNNPPMTRKNYSVKETL